VLPNIGLEILRTALFLLSFCLNYWEELVFLLSEKKQVKKAKIFIQSMVPHLQFISDRTHQESL